MMFDDDEQVGCAGTLIAIVAGITIVYVLITALKEICA